MRYLLILFALIVFIPILNQFIRIFKEEVGRKKRMKFYELHTEFINKCHLIEDQKIKQEALEWLLQNLTSIRNVNVSPPENFENDFYEMWGKYIPEYKSKIMSTKRNQKLKILGI